jgi:hypothetical protein
LEYLGLQNKPKAEVHPGHKLTGPKEEEEEKKKKKKAAIGCGVECTAKFSYLINLRYTTNFNCCDRDYKGEELNMRGQTSLRVHAFWRLKMAIHSQAKKSDIKGD